MEVPAGARPVYAPRVLRALLLVLSLLLAVPAAAMPACHDAPAASAHRTDGHDRPAPVDGPHVCAGCIPPSDWLAPRVAAPAMLPAATPTARVARLVLRQWTSPPLPPPRLG